VEICLIQANNMRAHKPEVFHTVIQQKCSVAGDGMHVELIASMDSPAPLINFREDEKLGMQVLLHSADRDVAFLLAELESAITWAKQVVHMEPFYD